MDFLISICHGSHFYSLLHKIVGRVIRYNSENILKENLSHEKMLSYKQITMAIGWPVIVIKTNESMIDHQHVSHWSVKVCDFHSVIKMNSPHKNSWRQVSPVLPDHSEEEIDCELGISCGLSCICDHKQWVFIPQSWCVLMTRSALCGSPPRPSTPQTSHDRKNCILCNNDLPHLLLT